MARLLTSSTVAPRDSTATTCRVLPSVLMNFDELKLEKSELHLI